MKNIIGLLTIIFVLLSFSCTPKGKPKSISSPQTDIIAPQKDYEKEKYVKATVIDMRELDGCTYLLKLNDNSRLEPDNLGINFQKNNLPVWIKFNYRKGVASICMSGRMVTLTHIALRKSDE